MPHGHCFLWQPDILWLHVISDLLIGIAYYSIPLALVYFARKRPDMPFRWLFVLFSLFILLCGTTHFFSIWVLWHPDYGIEGLIKAATAFASVITALLVWKLMPQMLMAPSPGQLQKLNAKLVLTNENIEMIVRERTAELAEANRKLEEAYKLTEKASNTKSEFLANMSHEIRTPMNAVIGLSQILAMSKPLTEKQQQYVDTLKVSAESLLALITDLLDISKIESEVVALDNVNFNLHQLVNESVSILSVKAREKTIGLYLDFDENLKGDFVGDPTRIRQMFLNLISNAVKFTEEGQVNITVKELKGSFTQQRSAVITVKDSGIGIPADKLDSIFSKFSQADSTITRKYGGTGLGLAITKSLIELMGGSISVTSELGKGSSFVMQLPLATPDEVQTTLVDQKKKTGSKQGGSNKTILLVEDYQPNILVATTILEALNYRFDIALNGDTAIKKLTEQKFDLILMDVQMPVMDGYRTTRIIRQQEAASGAPHIPIIGITAFAMAVDKEKCFAAGMDDYIAKPYNIDALREKISQLLHTDESAQS
jgi:signal transduction histidine kinase/CheY-like chemotaxis protein